MQFNLRSLLLVGVLAVGPTSGLMQGAFANPVSSHKIPNKFENQIRHELIMMPWLGVFDDLSFQVDGSGHVTLLGQVTRPTLRSDAENIVKRIEGVTSVTNNIEVLPLSPMDDQIRLAAYRSIFGFSSLGRYSWGPVPPVHIIVKNGNLTLTGVVATDMDKNMAGIRANGVAGVFSVQNDLVVEKNS